ncbi:hypothetical protein QWJ07_24425 [Frankia sp. RB7]|nr:hypothetical protein [Frankia sp. RB7]
MLYRPSRTFRNTAFAVTAVAAIAGASVMTSFPANAQQATAANFSPACAPFAGTERGVRCEIEQSQLRTKANEVRAAKTEEVIACMKDLGKFKERNPEGFAKLGAITRDNACAAAAKIPPRPTASLN